MRERNWARIRGTSQYRRNMGGCISTRTASARTPRIHPGSLDAERAISSIVAPTPYKLCRDNQSRRPAKIRRAEKVAYVQALRERYRKPIVSLLRCPLDQPAAWLTAQHSDLVLFKPLRSEEVLCRLKLLLWEQQCQSRWPLVERRRHARRTADKAMAQPARHRCGCVGSNRCNRRGRRPRRQWTCGSGRPPRRDA